MAALNESRQTRRIVLLAAAAEEVADMLAATVGVLIPVGPLAGDVAPLDDLLDSFAHWERPAGLHLVIIDDARGPRPALDRTTDWRSVTLIRRPMWQRRRAPGPFAAMTAGTLLAIETPQRCEYPLKLDVDALVIGPFVSKIREAFAEGETMGIVGSHDITCTGEQRDWTVWHRPWTSLVGRCT